MSSKSIIMDVGSATVKAGVPQETKPALVFSNVVGEPQLKKASLFRKQLTSSASSQPSNGPKYVVGDAVLEQLATMKVHRPMNHGVVTTTNDWELMSEVCNYTFQQLESDPESTGVTLTQPPFNPRECTERWATTFFESFMVPHMAFVPQGLCSLYASGRTSGVVLESGEGVTHVTPVYESFAISRGMNRLDIGGGFVTNHLCRLLYERGYSFANSADVLLVQKIKEQHAFVEQEYDKALAMPEGELASFEMPDGQHVELSKERFRAPELLFNPTIVQSEMPSLQQFVSSAVKNCAIDTRRALLSSVVLSGGNTLFNGFAQRLQSEVVKFFPGLFGSVKVIEAPDRIYNTWAGAAVLASLDSFKPLMITKEVYDDVGPSVVHNYRKEATEEEVAAVDQEPS